MKRNALIVIGLIATVAIAGVGLMRNKKELVNKQEILATIQNGSSSAVVQVSHIQTPKIVKAAYLTAPSAGWEERVASIIEKRKTEGLNAVVIDIKDSYGVVGYDTKVETAVKYDLKTRYVKDLPGLVKRLHDEGIYVIARIAVFEDTALAKARPEIATQDGVKLKAAGMNSSKKTIWQDRKKLSWIDPSSQEAWEYNIALANEVKDIGFDEVNFDYVRFPSDGKTSAIWYPLTKDAATHRQVIREFFKYVREHISGVPISFDLFAFTAIEKEDIGIGQVLEDAYAYADYVDLMAYPSHYPPYFLG